MKKSMRWLAFLVPSLLAATLTTCKPRNEKSGLSITRAGDPYPLGDYVKDCVAELGEIPQVKCDEGKPVPIFNSDQNVEITDKNHAGMSQTCDKPYLLRTDNIAALANMNSCVPFTQYGHPAAQQGYPTIWAWTCRRYYTRSLQNPFYDDINVIGHNPQTGGTCFFVSKINRTQPTPTNENVGWDGREVPDLNASSIEREKFWRTPHDMTELPAWRGGSEPCVNCHDNDPFLHSPFIRQMQTDTYKLPSNPNGKYYAIGKSYFQTDTWKLKHLVSKEAEACTSCHRIGSKRTCDDLAEMAIGARSSRFLTNAFKGKAWMPQESDHWEFVKPEGSKLAEMQKAVKFIKACCANPKANGCEWEAVPR